MNEKRELPKGWTEKNLKEVAEIRSGSINPAKYPEETFELYSIPAFENSKTPEKQLGKNIRSNKVIIEPGDCLFSKLNPRINRVWVVPEGQGYRQIATTEFWPIYAKAKDGSSWFLPQFLELFLSWDRLRYSLLGQVEASTKSRQRLKPDQLLEQSIDLPPVPVQERLVEILQQADAIRRKRAEARHLADQILPALFYYLLEQNQIKIAKVPLKEIALLKTGGTPSRKKAEYWNGPIPWVSPSDMKELEILDTSEHIAEEALSNSSTTVVEPGTILIVVRSGILAHTFPVAIARNRLAFNQDIKALIPNPDIILPEYLLWALNARKAEVLRRMVKHGSTVHSIDSTLFNEMLIPIPPLSFQKNFVFQAEQLLNTVEQSQKSYADAINLFASLLAKAFTGELTVEWEAENAAWIAAQQTFYERLPRLALLTLLAEKAQRTKTQTEVLVTALMKYAFLLQMESTPRHRLYHFIPYHYGPFAKELYTDLHALQNEGVVAVAEDADEDKTRITLADPQKAVSILQDLPEDQRELVNALRQDAATIIETYGDLNHGDLLATVYEKYPVYAKKSKLRKRRN